MTERNDPRISIPLDEKTPPEMVAGAYRTALSLTKSCGSGIEIRRINVGCDFDQQSLGERSAYVEYMIYFLLKGEQHWVKMMFANAGVSSSDCFLSIKLPLKEGGFHFAGGSQGRRKLFSDFDFQLHELLQQIKSVLTHLLTAKEVEAATIIMGADVKLDVLRQDMDFLKEQISLTAPVS